MPRPERVIDPADGVVPRFAVELRKLRRSAGSPSYRELAGRAHYAATTLAEAAAGNRLPTLPVTLAYVRACGGDVEMWEARWQAAAAEVEAVSVAARGTDGRPPYLGLAAYGPQDADRFFGRDRLVATLVERLGRQRFAAVVGASGSGKSSVLRAGLLPALQADDHLTLLITPSAHPLRGVAVRVAAALGQPPGALVTDLAQHPRNLGLALRQLVLTRALDGELVLIVDQFEEVFTLCTSPGERDQFVHALVEACRDADNGVRVVLGLRADFYAHCARLPALVDALQDAQVLVGPMNAEELRQVITGPAAHAGLKVDDDLVATIMADAGTRAGVLPFVSHALWETWRRRGNGALTLAAYTEAGAIQGAIEHTAESLYAELEPTEQLLAKDMFLRLTALGQGTDDTRRRLPSADLLAGPEPDTAAVVLARLIEARLVTADDGQVQVAHEALIVSWPRLRGWLAEDREFALRRQRLAEAAAEWDQHGRDDGALYRGARLTAWEGADTDRLNAREGAFLAASRAQRARERRARHRRARLITAALLAVTLVTATAAGLAFVQARQAQEQRDVAASRGLVAHARAQLEHDPALALLLARHAARTMPTPEAESVLRQALLESRQRAAVPLGAHQVGALAYSRDGLRLATTGGDAAVRVWDTRTMREPLVLHGLEGTGSSVAFSPDGKRLAGSGGSGLILVWEPARPSRVVKLQHHRSPVSAVAFAADGRLAAAGEDGEVSVWTAGGRLARLLPHGRIPQASVAFSPDGTLLATGGVDGVVRVWGASGQARVLPGQEHTMQSTASSPDDSLLLRGRENSVSSIAFSPDGRWLAASGEGVRVWDLRGRDGPVDLPRQDGEAHQIAFHPDGRRVAGADGSTIWVRDWRSSSAPLLLKGHYGGVKGIAFSPNGTTLASTGEDGTLRLWDVQPAGAPMISREHSTSVRVVAVGADGRLAASVGQDGRMRLWHLAAGRLRSRALAGAYADNHAVAVSPDGRNVATASWGEPLRIWRAAGGPARELAGTRGAIVNLDYSPDGRSLLVTDGAMIRIWDVAGRGSLLSRPARAGPAGEAVYSPDGRRVAETGTDGTVTIWHIDQPERPVVLTGHQGPVSAISFSPDGSLIASGGLDGTVRVRRADGTGSVQILRAHRGIIKNVWFSPDGQWLATIADDNAVRLWRPAGSGDPVVYHGFDADISDIAFTSTGQLVSGHNDGTVRVWRCEVCGPLKEMLALADRRAGRQLTAEERAKYRL